MSNQKLGPNSAMANSTTTITGSVWNNSVTRMSTASAAPRQYPATMPTVPPISSAAAAAQMPIANDARVPISTRENTSRPILSVPIGNASDGASKLAATCSLGPCGAIHGSSTAIKPRADMTIIPASP